MQHNTKMQVIYINIHKIENVCDQSKKKKKKMLYPTQLLKILVRFKTLLAYLKTKLLNNLVLAGYGLL